MSSLHQFLRNKNYHQIQLEKTSTNHLSLDVRINGIEGKFILDTGASHSCVGLSEAEHFDLLSEDSEIRVAGAGSNSLLTRISTHNKIEIGDWKKTKFDLVLFSMKHINQALSERESEEIHGIIGADILEKGKAIIDYKKKHLYLK